MVRRIVLEGRGERFKPNLREWLEKTCQIINQKIEDDGLVSVLSVEDETCRDISSRLRSGDGPGGLYCAVIPPATDNEMPETIAGPAFESEQARLENSPGRCEIYLGALPPKIGDD